MRKLAWFAGSYAGAAFLAVYLLPEGVLLPAGSFCAAAGLAGLFLKEDKRLRLLLLGFGLGAGLLWTGVYTALFHTPARLLSGTEGTITAQVTNWPEEDSRWVEVRFRQEEGGWLKALLWLEAVPEDLRPGDEVTVTASFELADDLAGERSDYYYSKGVTLWAYAKEEPEVTRPDRVPVRYWPVYVSHAIRQSALRAFPDSVGPLVSALITGDTSGLDGNFYSALRRTGAAHVVAVSGLHVSFLAGLITVLLGRRRRLSAGVGIALMFFFAAAAGNTPSVLRAAFMQSMLLLAPLLDREDDRATSLSTILMLLLVQNPYAAASISLQLSFAAAAGIYLFTGPLCQRWQSVLPYKPEGFWLKLGCMVSRFVMASLAVSLGAIAFTTPLSAYYFDTVALISPLANLLILWAVSDLFLGGLVVAVVGLLLPGLAALLGLVVSLAGYYLLWMVPALAAFPFAAVSAGSVYIRAWLGLVYALLLVHLILPGGKKGLVLPFGLSIASLCWALLLHTGTYTAGQMTVSVLDVGQGLSTAIYAQGASALVDCGGSGVDDAGDIAADWFQGLGLSRIDVVVLTHYHDDHANGVARLLERMEVGLLVLPDVEPEDPLRQSILALAEENGVDTLLLTERADLTLGSGSLTIYPPLGGGDVNEEGLSVLCTAGEFDALITGDMDQVIEGRLIKYGDLPDIELLVAGHHGSKYSTSEELLLALRPELAAISVGYNTYGHPAPETLERLAAAGCGIYRTDWSGTVTITAR